MESVGFLGLGKMGTAMATRLLGAGCSLTVWNRSSDKTEILVQNGANLAASPAELANSVDIVITMLSNDAVTEAIYQGNDGLLSGDIKDKLFIDMSTLRPSTVSLLADNAQNKGASFIDAPVSGTVAPAEKGQLLVLCGAKAGDLSRARPVLEILSRRIIHAGPVGQGALLKLVVNLPLAIYWGSLAEALSMGAKGGLNLELMLNAIQDSSAALAVLPLKTPQILGQSESVAFDVAGMQKDLSSMLKSGQDHGVPMPITTGTLTSYDAAAAGGFGAKDAVEIIRFLMEHAGSQQNDKEES